MKCDCTILLIHSYDYIPATRLSTVKKDLEWHFKDTVKPLDRRKCLTTMYNYCPWCGEKIDWDKIKKGLKEEE